MSIDIHHRKMFFRWFFEVKKNRLIFGQDLFPTIAAAYVYILATYGIAMGMGKNTKHKKNYLTKLKFFWQNVTLRAIRRINHLFKSLFGKYLGHLFICSVKKNYFEKKNIFFFPLGFEPATSCVAVMRTTNLAILTHVYRIFMIMRE